MYQFAMKALALSLFLLVLTLGQAPAFINANTGHDIYRGFTLHFETRSRKYIDYYGDYAARLSYQESAKPDWEQAKRRAKEFLNGWNVEELVTLTSGVGWAKGELSPQPHRNGSVLTL